MPEVWFAIPGDPDTLTGGYVYARRLTAALPAAGWTPRSVRWPGSFPNPSPEDLALVRANLEQIPENSVVLIDGLAYGALPTSVLDGLNLRIVALVHHPLARESGLSPADVKRFESSERVALARACGVVTTSEMTARTLAADFGVTRSIIDVAVPGTEPAPRARGAGSAPLILTVGTLTRRKGHDILISALSKVRDLPWTSRIVGSTTRDPSTAAALGELVQRHDLGQRVALVGEVEVAGLREIYRQAGVFALASRYEGYGMVFAEALAHGLPIVACTAGAVTDTVPADAGLLVAPDDPQAFADALRLVLTDSDRRAGLSEAAWRHGCALPRWSDTAAAVAGALTRARSAT